MAQLTASPSHCRAALAASPGNDSHAGAGGAHFQWLYWRGALSQRPSVLGNSLHQRLRALFRYGTWEETIPSELNLTLFFSIPAAKASPPLLWTHAVPMHAAPFALLLMLLFFAAQSPSVAETLHPAFTGVQQYAGTASPSLLWDFLCSTPRVNGLLCLLGPQPCIQPPPSPPSRRASRSHRPSCSSSSVKVRVVVVRLQGGQLSTELG